MEPGCVFRGFITSRSGQTAASSHQGLSEDSCSEEEEELEVVNGGACTGLCLCFLVCVDEQLRCRLVSLCACRVLVVVVVKGGRLLLRGNFLSLSHVCLLPRSSIFGDMFLANQCLVLN